MSPGGRRVWFTATTNTSRNSVGRKLDCSPDLVGSGTPLVTAPDFSLLPAAGGANELSSNPELQQMFDNPIARCTACCRKILDIGIEVPAAEQSQFFGFKRAV